MKKYIYLFLFYLFANVSYGQENSCKVLLHAVADKYEGECKKGKAHGIGRAEGEDVYEGSFKKGWPDGEGTYIWRYGRRYVGEFKRGVMDGYGEMHNNRPGADSLQVGYWRDGYYIGTEDVPNYQITERNSVEDVKVSMTSHNGKSVRVRILRDGLLNTAITNVRVNSDSGNARDYNGEFIFEDVDFPLEISVNYNTPNKLHTSTLSCRFRIKINIEGDWEVRLAN